MQFAATASEEAKKINRETGIQLKEDQAYWEQYGIFTGEDLAIMMLTESYSDLYKSLHGVRPRKVFDSVEAVQKAIADLDRYAKTMIEWERLEAEQQAAYELERSELEALMPGYFDFEEFPKMSGMGRRMESGIKKGYSLTEALGISKPVKKIGAAELRQLIIQESRLIREQDEDGPELEIDVELADEAIDTVVKHMPDPKEGPGKMKDFLNGPGSDYRVRAVIAAGREDGSVDDEAASPAETSKKIGDLSPTQLDIDLTKSIAFPLSRFKALKKMISGGTQRIGPPGNDTIVTNGGIIVDGHHRWSGLFSVAGPDGQIAAFDLGLPEKDAASTLAAAQAGIAATLDGGEDVPSAKVKPGTNILGKSKGDIADMIRDFIGKSTDAGVILTDEFAQMAIDDEAVSSHFDIAAGSSVEDAKEAIIDKVAGNLAAMNQPAPGSPDRTDMPQLDKAKGGVEAVVDSLSQGKVNYKDPVAQEAAVSDKDLVMERWQKLAGLLNG